ncbi:aldo/keto reductase [Paenibacillus sp. sptzw28]|uniref:aldo/keto reductase n=1 Tax=Paenibacillus sp. sptzw28 TaxID=715179 RepID=UPI001C6E2FA6|nr:aldo/keto reductase [Paenibacillus sp. sptzw28]QYR20894.1 aldo/keto reductase [Paenibacillus sp. sptzw28]
MEKRQYGNTGMNVSILGFGGAEIGFQGATVEQAGRLLGSALDAGLNVIDTAECYDSSEELIGKAVSHRRDDFYLFTKCGHASGFDLPDWNPMLLEQSIDRSLRRLQTDYIDVIHLHSCSEELLRQGDVIDVLMRAKEKGKTRLIGYSGDHKAALYAVRSGKFDSLETSINIADSEAIELTVPEAAKQGMGVVAKRPIANVAWKTGKKPEDRYQHTYWERLEKLDYDFLHGDLRNSVRTALRFTLSVPGVHTAIVGTAKTDRWLENAKLLNDGLLSGDEYREIRSRWKEKAAADWVGQG